MPLVPEAVERLAAEFGRLPGVGPKTAQRLTFYCLRAPADMSQRLAGALNDLHTRVRPCSRCFFIADGPLCAICTDAKRDGSLLCVVEEALDVLAVERSGEFHGLYHVLGGALSALDGVGPSDLNLSGLVARVANGGVSEMILAVNATVEGQTTAHYIIGLLTDYPVKVTRLAHGVPVGGELDYLDDGTLAAAMRQRTAF